MTQFAFGKCLRLLKPSDFQAIFNNAPLRASHKHLLVLARPNGLDRPRLGLVIAKKHIRLAVQRNRIKRIARESFRIQQHKLAGIDAIVLARRELDHFDNAKLQQIFRQQWRRISDKANKHQQTRQQEQTQCQNSRLS